MFCDNQAVVHMVRSGKTNDNYLGKCLRNIWLHVSRWDITLDVLHIAGKHNYHADKLSHIHSTNSVLDKSCFAGCLWENVPATSFLLDCSI